jgi:glucosamine 6-phosphate synthetase-like amidotransferase/phosphosugar isomerase protein
VISKMLKSHQNLFILAKGVGNFVGNFMAQKFLQIANLHAEAYACAEFRHGPLSMIDEVERTPGKNFIVNMFLVIFIVLEDEHKS